MLRKIAYSLPLIFASIIFTAHALEIKKNPVDIKEWTVPYSGQPRDPYAANADKIWFVGQRGHYLGRFTPANENFIKYDLPDEAGPHNLIVSANGIVWYSGNLAGYIGRYDPITNHVTKVQMPSPDAKDPHTLVFDHTEAHIWFTVQWGNFIGRLTVADLSVKLFAIPSAKARPYGIKLADDGTPWIALLGSNKLAQIDLTTLQVKEHALPAKDARPRRLEIDNKGRIWYADYARGTLGMYTPKTQSAQEWPLPYGADSHPYATALDRHQRIWVVATGTQPNLLIGFATDTEEIVSITPIPSGAGSVRHMHYHPSSETIWFGTDKQTLARAVIRFKE